MPVCGVLMCMTLTDADRVAKQLLLFVEPAGHPKRWDTVVIKRLRKCEYQECYRSRVIVTESPVFSDDSRMFATGCCQICPGHLGLLMQW